MSVWEGGWSLGRQLVWPAATRAYHWLTTGGVVPNNRRAYDNLVSPTELDVSETGSQNSPPVFWNGEWWTIYYQTGSPDEAGFAHRAQLDSGDWIYTPWPVAPSALGGSGAQMEFCVGGDGNLLFAFPNYDSIGYDVWSYDGTTFTPVFSHPVSADLRTMAGQLRLAMTGPVWAAWWEYTEDSDPLTLHARFNSSGDFGATWTGEIQDDGMVGFLYGTSKMFTFAYSPALDIYIGGGNNFADVAHLWINVGSGTPTAFTPVDLGNRHSTLVGIDTHVVDPAGPVLTFVTGDAGVYLTQDGATFTDVTDTAFASPVSSASPPSAGPGAQTDFNEARGIVALVVDTDDEGLSVWHTNDVTAPWTLDNTNPATTLVGPIAGDDTP